MLSLLADDLDHVFERTAPLWEELRRARVFVTGGTGFFGCWLLETALSANERLSLGLEVTVLARDYGKFVRKAPHLATHPRLRFIEGNVRSFEFPDGEFSHIVHAATDSTLKLTPENRAQVSETIVEGTRRVLRFADRCGSRRLLFTSSGAVYGPQPSDMPLIHEDYEAQDLTSAYAEGKRVAEELCMQSDAVEPEIARCFAFVGPHLPLDAHFAIGNFIADALAGRPISHLRRRHAAPILPLRRGLGDLALDDSRSRRAPPTVQRGIGTRRFHRATRERRCGRRESCVRGQGRPSGGSRRYSATLRSVDVSGSSRVGPRRVVYAQPIDTTHAELPPPSG